jgi:hypothetical protein
MRKIEHATSLCSMGRPAHSERYADDVIAGLI